MLKLHRIAHVAFTGQSYKTLYNRDNLDPTSRDRFSTLNSTDYTAES